MRYLLAIFLTIGFLTPSISFASSQDPITEIIQILEEMDHDENLMSQYTASTPDIEKYTQSQLTQTQNEWQALTKAYSMGDTQDEQNARLWSADDWNQVLSQASNGNNARFQELMNSYSSMYPNVNSSQNINAKNLESTSYAQAGQTTNAALATSNYTYDEINDHIKSLENILHEVDDANKNQNEKAAIDLNSRLVAELGFIQLEILKLQSVHTQMMATKNQSELNDDTVDKLFTNKE